METPEVKFAYVGEDRIGYQVIGEGPDVVYFSGMLSHLDIRWENPELASFLRRISSFSRLISFDRRGSGVSDDLPPGQPMTWEVFVEDVGAVMDAAGSERAVVFAVLDAGPTGVLFAASHPDRTSGLILSNTSARFVRDDDYPEGFPPEVGGAMLRTIEESWGSEAFAQLAVPSRTHDAAFVRWYSKIQRASMRPRQAAGYLRGVIDLDVRHALPSVRVPTLVLHATGYTITPIAHGRYIADRIPGARLVELPGSDGVLATENVDRVIDEVEELVTGVRRAAEPDRVLATVLFTDIVGSTEQAAAMGDRRWREMLRRHEDAAKDAVAAFRGRFVKATGDGILATFDGPTRAVRCAAEIRVRAKSLGFELRMGLHTGEVELLGEDIGGIAVHIAARAMAEAGAHEIISTATVKDLVVGSEIAFADRGARALKGIPGEWRLYEALV